MMTVGKLARQTIWHVAARLVSSACSFLLFTFIARKLDDAEAQRAFFFLFTLGFGLATLRLFVQLAAGINGQRRASVRLRQARKGLICVIKSLPYAVPLLGISLWFHTGNLIVVAVACFVTCLVAIDIDLFRAVVHREPSFSSTFTFGTLIALAGLSLHSNPDLESVCFWILVQWIPVGLFNSFIFTRLADKRMPTGETGRPTHLASILFLAIFDGAILNTPFLGWFTPPPSTGVDLSLGIRVFVASLPMQPMLLHWANSNALAELAENMGMGLATSLSMLLLISGVISGSAFIFIYIMVTGKQVSAVAIIIYFVLLLSYSYYVSQMRLSAPLLTVNIRIGVLSVFLLVYVISFVIFEPILLLSALYIGLLQAFTLSTCALALALMSRRVMIR